jgi:hypothetical protein
MRLQFLDIFPEREVSEWEMFSFGTGYKVAEDSADTFYVLIILKVSIDHHSILSGVPTVRKTPTILLDLENCGGGALKFKFVATTAI